MITITDIGAKHGYSGHDHLIRGDYQSLLGRRYHSVRDIRRAVSTVQQRTEDRRCRHVPIWVAITLSSGERRNIDA